MWIKIGTTQYRQYDFVGRPDVIGRIFFYFRGIGWGGGYDIWSKRCVNGNVKIIIQFVYVRLYYIAETDYCTYYPQVKL